MVFPTTQAGMVQELKEMGVELMLSPYFHEVTPSSKHYQAAIDNGYIVLGFDGKPASDNSVALPPPPPPRVILDPLFP